MRNEKWAKLLGVGLRVGVYALFVVAGMYLFGQMLALTGNYLLSAAMGGFLAAVVGNALVMRIFERASLADIGLGWNRASIRNLLVGLAGGTGAACLVLVVPVVCRVAEFQAVAGAEPRLRTMLYVTVVLMFGAIGEEMLFRGYAFQVLVGSLGPFATVLPFGILFGLAHASNLGISALGLVNTMLWGVLLGYAFVISGDLWLPIGLHFGWNWALPLFGANLSGFTMELTGYALHWKIGPAWSGGEYGPEGGILTTVVVLLLFAYVWKAPIRCQRAFLLRDPEEA